MSTTITCPMCGGTGAADREATVRCGLCGGNGSVLAGEALAAREAHSRRDDPVVASLAARVAALEARLLLVAAFVDSSTTGLDGCVPDTSSRNTALWQLRRVLAQAVRAMEDEARR